MLLQHIARHALARGRTVKPLLCVSFDFCVRLFVQVGQQPPKGSPDGSQALFGQACRKCGWFSFRTKDARQLSCPQQDHPPSVGVAVAAGVSSPPTAVPAPKRRKVVMVDVSARSASAAKQAHPDKPCPSCEQVSLYNFGPLWASAVFNHPHVLQLCQLLESWPQKHRLPFSRPLKEMLLRITREPVNVPLFTTIRSELVWWQRYQQEHQGSAASQMLHMSAAQPSYLRQCLTKSLQSQGYIMGSSHLEFDSIKTNCPITGMCIYLGVSGSVV